MKRLEAQVQLAIPWPYIKPGGGSGNKFQTTAAAKEISVIDCLSATAQYFKLKSSDKRYSDSVLALPIIQVHTEVVVM